MKRFKKIMALVIAMAMVLGMTSMAAFADEPGSITITPSSTVTLENKTLKAYKILDATYGSTGTLGGTPAQAIAYTIPAKMANFYNTYFAQAADNTVDPPVAAATVAQLAAAAGKSVDQYVVDRIAALDAKGLKDFEYAALAAAKTAGVTATSGSKSGNNVVFSNLEAGYYVIEDEGAATPLSAVMLDTVSNANVEIQLKASDDTKKEILPAGDLVNNKANELGLGRAVNYKISQKIPDTTGYDYYYYMINDTLSPGLTFNPDTVVVKVGNQTLTKGVDYYLYYDNGNTEDAVNTTTKTILNGKTFIVAFTDIVADVADTSKTYFTAGADVEVTYTATVNSNAVTGVDPNNNKVNVEYSNNPDKDGKGDYDTNHPGIPKNDDDHPTGVGPDKFTDTYTTKIKIKKVDGSNEALEGVEFTLTGTSKDAVFAQEKVFEIDSAGSYWLLKNGKYTETAPRTAPTVRETTGGAGWVKIEGSDTYAGADIRVVGTDKYRPYVEATDSAKTRYVIVEANDADYASLTTKYSLKTITTTDSEEYKVSRTGTTTKDSNNDAVIDFAQLGAGTYKLSETGVLAGYNGIEDIEFTVACQLPNADAVVAGTEKATWTVTTDNQGVSFVEGTGDDAGTFTITIKNNQGTALPSTGGIGTTIFYVVGAILVIGAGVVMITRRRMDA